MNLKITNRLFLFLVLVLLLGMNSCRLSKQPLTMLNEGAESPVSFRLLNHYGNAVVFAGSGEDGAVGYMLNGELVWLKGQPQKSSASDSLLSWQWNQDGQAVAMEAVFKDKRVDFRFSLPSGEKPSAWFLNLKAGADEYFTGIFERVVDGVQNESWKTGITTGLNLRGERMDVKLKPTVSAYAPFYISSENYAFFAHGTWPGVIDFCREDPERVQISFEGPELVFSLMTDESPAGLVSRHALETGPSFVPPRWAFGPWRWRDEHVNRKTYFDSSLVKAPYNSEIVEDILMMQAYDIPCTAYWIDRPWGPGIDGFDDYEIDYGRLLRKWFPG